MLWKEHLELRDSHAFLSASNYHWLNYDEEKLKQVYMNNLAKEKGTRLHKFAAECIELGQKLPKSKRTLNSYVNDAIGFKMKPEQILFYSINCYGTADCISFKKKKLRIHDLKTGNTKASMKQLYIYDALFCLEYNINPGDVDIENRIYQNDDIEISIPDIDIISHIMDKIITFDKIINKIIL